MRQKISYQIIINLALFLIATRIIIIGIQIYNVGDSYYLKKSEALKQTLAILVDSDKRSPLSGEELEQRLIIAYNANLFDFYKVEVPAAPEVPAPEGAAGSSFAGSAGGLKTVYQTDNITSLETQDLKPAILYTSDDYTVLKNQLTRFSVTVGFNSSRSGQVIRAVKPYGVYLLIDFFLLTLIVTMIVRFRLEVLSSISKILSKLTPRDLQNISHPSTEIRTIVNYLRSFIEQYSKSETQRDVYKRNMADGITRELFLSKKKPPYVIQAIVVRFDMNNYTRRALQENTGALTSLLSQYFQRVKELRLRYGGLDYQFIGDEKVLFFKVENEAQFETQLLRAVAFLRDAFKIAQEMSDEIILTFKAALVPGNLTFYELDGSHYFTGTPLIESARYLTTIAEKDRSIMSMPTSQCERVKILTKPFFSEAVMLKGYEVPLDISYFDRFDYDFKVNTFNVDDFRVEKDPMLFLSDHGFVQIINVFFDLMDAGKMEQFIFLYQKIRGVVAVEVVPAVVNAYERLLTQGIEQFKSIEHENRILSSVVALSWVFIPCGFENSRIKEKLYSLVRHKDVRVASNALMASQRYEWNEDIIGKMLVSPSNRLRGDALLLLGRRGVDEKFFKAWKQLIENKDSLFVLSGLWASQEVFKFHSENNPTHLKSNPLVENMVDLISKLKKHAQKQVGQRADWALEAVTIS
jgi:hypothetical protein